MAHDPNIKTDSRLPMIRGSLWGNVLRRKNPDRRWVIKFPRSSENPKDGMYRYRSATGTLGMDEKATTREGPRVINTQAKRKKMARCFFK